MTIVGGTRRRADWLPILAVLVVLPVTVGAAELSPAQQAVVDSLQAEHARGGPDAVTALVAEYLPHARADDDTLMLMRLLGARGASYVDHRRITPAVIGDLQESAALASSLGDSVSVARSLQWLARAHEVQGRHNEATRIYHRLAILGRDTGDQRLEGKGYLGIAWDRFVAGDYAAAESLYADGGRLTAAAGDTFSMLWGRNGQGLCSWNLGQIARADTVFAEVRQEAVRHGFTLIEGVAVNNHAGVLETLGRPGEALEGYRRAREMHVASNDLREAFPAGLNILRCLNQLGRLDEAEAFADTLLAEAEANGFRDLMPVAMEHRARIHLVQRRYALAARTCREALNLGAELRPRYEIQLYQALATALAAQDSLDAALATAERAAAIPSAEVNYATRADVALSLGEIHMRRGDHEKAATIFAAAGGDMAAAGMVGQQLALTSRAGEAWLLAGRPEQARPLLEESLELWESTRTLPDEPEWRERRSVAARRLFENLAELELTEAVDAPPSPAPAPMLRPAPALQGPHPARAHPRSGS